MPDTVASNPSQMSLNSRVLGNIGGSLALSTDGYFDQRDHDVDDAGEEVEMNETQGVNRQL